MNAMPNAKSLTGDTRLTETGPNNAWIVVITKANCERLLAGRLGRAGFEVYLPMRLKEVRAAVAPALGKAKVVQSEPAPFFPRYLFVRSTPDVQRWQQLFTTDGVQRVVCDPRRPTGVTDVFIQALRGREVDGLLRLGGPSAASAWRAGQKIKTMGGLLDAMCVEVVDGRRALLLASFFNSDSVRITVSLR